MRILISTRVFPPEGHPTAVMMLHLGRYLQARGWQVIFAVGYPSYPGGRLFPGFRRTPIRREVRDGIEIVRTWHPITGRRGFSGRLAAVGGQAVFTALAGFAQQRVDLVLTCGYPLLGPALWSIVARSHRAPLVNVVYDIYPDIAVETGHLRNRWAIRMARIAEQYQFRVSDLMIVLSDGFRDVLAARGMPRERIAVVPVWLDPEEIRPMPRDNSWRREHGVELNKIVVLYAGSVGAVSGARVVVGAAELLQHREDILFMFVGGGGSRASLEEEVRRRRLGNVRFLPFQDRRRLSEVQATGDIGLVTLAPGLGKTSVPSKMVGYLAAGRPILASVELDSDIGLEVAAHDLGLVVPPGDAEALAEAVVRLGDNPGMREACGRRSRRRFETYYASDHVLDRYYQALCSVVER